MATLSRRIEPSADVDDRATLGEGTRIWHLAQVREFAVIGDDCTIGRGAYVDAGVRIGNRCKLQNYALVYAPAEIRDGVFIGPGAILTNDVYPRSVDVKGHTKGAGDWEAKGIVVGEGASIGARSVLVAGVNIGQWALVGAGAVVTRPVPAHALMLGVPARQSGWVGFAGVPLDPAGGENFRCPQSGDLFQIQDGALQVTS